MVSLPPRNPGSGSHVEPRAVGGPRPEKGAKPEAVRYMLACWAVMIAGELLHQLLTVISVVIDPAPLKESAKQATKGQGDALSDATLNAGMWATVVVAGLIQLAIIGVFAAGLSAVSSQKKWAPGARRMLQLFAVFFAIRAAALYVALPSSTAVPVAFFAADGIIQIILAVAGVLGVIYSSQKESRDYVEAGADTKPGGGAGGPAR